MHFNVSRIPNGVRARLRDELSIASIAEDRIHLVQLLQPASVLELHLEGLTEIDTAGVQLLVAMRKEAAGIGCTCRLSESGERVMDAFGRLGLAHHLQEPLVGTGGLHGS